MATYNSKLKKLILNISVNPSVPFFQLTKIEKPTKKEKRPKFRKIHLPRTVARSLNSLR